MPIYRMGAPAWLGWDVEATDEAEARAAAQRVYDVLHCLTTTIPAFDGAASEIVVLPAEPLQAPSIQDVSDEDDEVDDAERYALGPWDE